MKAYIYKLQSGTYKVLMADGTVIFYNRRKGWWERSVYHQAVLMNCDMAQLVSTVNNFTHK